MGHRKALPVANASNMRREFAQYRLSFNSWGVLAESFEKAHGRGRAVEAAMKLAEEALEVRNHIESISGAYVNGYWGNSVAVYVNVGDLYSPTIIYDVLAGKFYVGDIGSWREWRESNREYRLSNPEF